MKNKTVAYMIAGAAAGAVSGFFGAGGGLILVPLLSRVVNVDEHLLFPSSLSIMLPLCITALLMQAFQNPIPWMDAAPYLIGSIPGGIAAGVLSRRVPTVWLHRILGAFILTGGIRFLCR